MVDIIAPAGELFLNGWIGTLELHRRRNVPDVLRADGRNVAMRCYNLFRTIGTFGADVETNDILAATRFFEADGVQLTSKGKVFQDSCLDYLTFCCNEISRFVNDEHKEKWQEVRNALFRRIVPQDIQKGLNAMGQSFERWD